MSIKWKINLLLLIIGITTSILVSAFNYYEAKEQVFKDAFAKARMISSYAMATRDYTVKTMRPLATKIAGKLSFHPELMGGFFVARSVADIFSKSEPGYSFKQATLDPVNIKNAADGQETEIIEYFSVNREEKEKSGAMEKNGVTYFYVAKPVVTKKGCLKCHGRRENAPKGRVLRYPGPSGYNYSLNDVVATFITYVPIQKALEGVRSMAFRTVLIGICGIFVIVIVVWLFIGNSVTKPIIRLTRMADEISRGKEINREIKASSTDEIGSLYEAFDRMRISVIKLVRALKKNK